MNVISQDEYRGTFFPSPLINLDSGSCCTHQMHISGLLHTHPLAHNSTSIALLNPHQPSSPLYHLMLIASTISAISAWIGTPQSTLSGLALLRCIPCSIPRPPPFGTPLLECVLHNSHRHSSVKIYAPRSHRALRIPPPPHVGTPPLVMVFFNLHSHSSIPNC